MFHDCSTDTPSQSTGGSSGGGLASEEYGCLIACISRIAISAHEGGFNLEEQLHSLNLLEALRS